MKRKIKRVIFYIREFIEGLSSLMEAVIGFLILVALLASFAGFVWKNSPLALFNAPETFSSYLSTAMMLVIGLEFARMLCIHSMDSVIEIMLMAAARQMVAGVNRKLME